MKAISKFVDMTENVYIYLSFLKLEQLERLHSDDAPPPPPPPPMITHNIESYWIPSQKKAKSKLQILRIRQNFLNIETNITRDTPSEVAW